MIEIREVKTKKEIKDFIEFPLTLYKDNPNFVPPLYADELKMFKKGFTYSDTCDHIFFNAYEDNKIVGRISGIIQKAANEKNNEKRARFIRYDSIDNIEVSKMLFDAVEQWALEKGMDTIVGPLNYSDLEREGLLIEGFDQLSTFEEQYNAEYYQHHIESLGYIKEVDWTESQIFYPKDYDGSLAKMADFILKRYNLHIGTAKNTNDFLNKYADGFFDILDKSYENIYGTVPFTDNMKKLMISNFKLIINLNYVVVVLDENEKVVCLGLCFPSIAKAVQSSGGRLTPLTIAKILYALKHPSIIDLALVGVDPDYLNKGISAIVASSLMNMLKNPSIKYAETNLNLEDNYAIQNLWKRFDEVKHKRRRSYVKKIKEDIVNG